MSSPSSNSTPLRPRRDTLPGHTRSLLGLLAGCATINLCMLVYRWSISSSILLGLFIAYLPHYFDFAQYKVTKLEGSRNWPWFTELPIWRWLFHWYFDASITSSYDFKTSVKEKGGQFIFAVHPHGVLSIDHFQFFTNACGFLTDYIPGPRRDLGASVIFLIPFFRDFCLWLGLVDAGAQTVHKVLSHGYSLQLFPGGISEQVRTSSTSPRIVAKGRMGFIKLALAYDVPIVPVFVFGEDKLYNTSNFLLTWRLKLAKLFKIGLPLFYGRLDSFGLLPYPKKLEAVLGDPIWPKGIDESRQFDIYKSRLLANNSDTYRRELNQLKSDTTGKGLLTQPGGFVNGRRVKREVSPEEVGEVHTRYVEALEELFEKHKHKHPEYKNVKLEILEAS